MEGSLPRPERRFGRVGMRGIPNHKKEKSKAPTLREHRRRMGHPKFQFKNKCKSKATANHRGVNYRSGIISGVMPSIMGNTDANGRASGELSERVEIVRKAHKRRIQIFAYANNHYALCRCRHKAYNAAFRIM